MSMEENSSSSLKSHVSTNPSLDVQVVNGNGSHPFKQNSFSSMSSNGSDSKLLKKMPILDTTYQLSTQPTSSLSTWPRSAGDILMGSTIPSSSPPHLYRQRRSSQSFGGGPDVTDSVPTRIGKTKSLVDEDSNTNKLSLRPSSGSINQLTRPRSGGDVLMDSSNSPSRSPRVHRRRSSQPRIEAEDGRDVTDLVPTRIGKTKSLVLEDDKSYNKSLNPSSGSSSSFTQPIPGGDVLMGPQVSCNGSTRSHRRHKSCQSRIEIKNPDVIDSAITRIGKTKSLLDDDPLKFADHLCDEAKCADKAPAHKASCCDVFCAMFNLKYIFSGYTILDLMLNLGSIGLYIFDFVTDWLNAFYYLSREDEQDHMFYFWLTVVVIVFPSLVMHAFSVWWEVEDNRHIRREKEKRNLKSKLGYWYYIWVTLSHILQIAPVYRYFRTIYYGVISRVKEIEGDKGKWKFYDGKYKGELSDVNFIRLMESFLEAAPQLVLQIYIMVRTTVAPTITKTTVALITVNIPNLSPWSWKCTAVVCLKEALLLGWKLAFMTGETQFVVAQSQGPLYYTEVLAQSVLNIVMKASENCLLKKFGLWKAEKVFLILQIVSVSVSLFGMSLSFVAYQRALRNTLEDKQQISAFASAVLFLYRSFTNISRVIALALLLNIYVWAWIGFFLTHWIIMTLAIWIQKTEFCPTKAKEVIYDFVIGFCYNFAYINVHVDNYNKYRMAAYYGLTFLVNTAIAMCWFYLRRGGGSLLVALHGFANNSSGSDEDENDMVIQANVALVIVVVVVVSFLFGMLFFFIYYVKLHPRAPGASCCITGEDNQEDVLEETAPVVTVKNCGDNYRVHRGAPQFRSWHSASLRCTLGDDVLMAKKKRPSSDIVKPSDTALYEEPPQNQRFSSALELDSTALPFSCIDAKNNGSGYRKIGTRSQHEHNTEAPQPAKEKEVIPASSRVLLNPPLSKDRLEALKVTEIKRDHFTRLIEEKQRKKKEIEHQQALLRMDVEKMSSSYALAPDLEIQDLFNRKQRARHLYASRRSFSAQLFVQPRPKVAASQSKPNIQTSTYSPRAVLKTTSDIELKERVESSRKTSAIEITEKQASPLDRQFRDSSLKEFSSQQLRPVLLRQRLHSTEETSSVSFTSVYPNRASESGTFPRCSRSAFRLSHQQSIPPYLRKAATLKPISEHKLSMHISAAREHSASLTNIALSQNRSPSSRTVPRAMSFTISKNEVVESIESSL